MTPCQDATSAGMTFKKWGELLGFSVLTPTVAVTGTRNTPHLQLFLHSHPLTYNDFQGTCPCKSTLVLYLHTYGILSTRMDGKSTQQQLLANTSHSRPCREAVMGMGHTSHPQYKGSVEQGATSILLLIHEANLLLPQRETIIFLELPHGFSLMCPR